LHLSKPLHRSSRQVRTFAVKIDGEGWIGVGADIGRCHGHGHPTPELAKLCALHRSLPAVDENVLLLPVTPSRAAERRRAAGS
jgi:hypothetical protein